MPMSLFAKDEFDNAVIVCLVVGLWLMPEVEIV